MLQLEKESYQPRPLLQRAMEVFDRMELHGDTQIKAQYRFVKSFLDWQHQPKPTAFQIRTFMRALDEFFFSGILSRGQHPNVRIDFRDDIFDQIDELREGDEATSGLTAQVDRRNTSAMFLIIRLDATQPYRREGQIVRNDLEDVLETLVHEMAHAYFMLFACPCESCQRELGATGHGPVWQELKQAMYRRIRRWDWSLRYFYADDQDDLDGPSETQAT